MGGYPSGLSTHVLATASCKDYYSSTVNSFILQFQGYLPLPTPLRSITLARKRGEYLSLVQLAFARDREGLDQQIWHQIEIDVPRTRPGVRLWMHEATQRVWLWPGEWLVNGMVNLSHRVWNVSFTFGPSDIQLADMFKGLMILLHLFSKCFCQHTLVCSV